MPKRALVTGIGGFVSGHLLAHIMKNTDWEVIGIDSFRHKGKTDRVNELLDTYPEYRKRLTIITHDLLAPISDQMNKSFGHLDYIFNIASESHVDRSISDPRPFIENNVSLMLTMLEFLRTRPEVETFIQCSTDEVYGPADERDHPEGEAHRPSNPYAASKSAQEQICYSYWRTYGLPIVITNTMNMIGQLQDTEKYTPKIIKAILNGDNVYAHVSPEGVPGSRYYLHARNMCDAMLFLVQNHTPALYPADDIDRFNIVSDDEIDNVTLPKWIAEIMGKDVKLKTQDFHQSRPGHDLRYGLDGGKLKALGWSPPISFKDGLETTVKWYLDHPDWLK
jgi:dTDP-glucose 4,6-dehydratase